MSFERGDIIQSTNPFRHLTAHGKVYPTAVVLKGSPLLVVSLDGKKCWSEPKHMNFNIISRATREEMEVATHQFEQLVGQTT